MNQAITLSLSSTMTKNLISISEDASLIAAYRLMIQHSIRHLTVTNFQQHIVGMISDRDLQRAMISQVTGEASFRSETCEFPEGKQVKDYMSWPAKTISQSTSLQSVCEKVLSEKVSAYLVTDGTAVTGIVTTDDLIKVLLHLLQNSGKTSKLGLDSLLSNPSIGQIAQTISDMGI